MILLKNVKPLIADPQYEGQCVDILVAASKIVAMGEKLDVGNLSVKMVDLEGRVVSPGIVDGHVHFIGAAWDEGFSCKTPEIFLSDFVKGGVTTAVGILGFGYGCEDLRNLNYKTQTLAHEGLSTYMYTGNFRCPPPSITPSAPEDIVTIPHVVGAKVSMTDKFSSHPSIEELMRLASEVYTAGLQTGKAGVLHIHIAEYGDAYEILEKVRAASGVPADRIVPTHCNTDKAMLENAKRYAFGGGVVDISAILEASRGCSRSIKASQAIEFLLNEGVAPSLITMSSDGNVALPFVKNDGTTDGLYVERVSSTWDNTKAMIMDGVEPALAISFSTLNPAQRLRFGSKGHLGVGMDADILVFDEKWNIEGVYMRGRTAMKNGKAIMNSPFEADVRGERVRT